MKKTFLLASALVAMVSCNKTLIETPISDVEFGYINFGLTADTEMVETKGITSSAKLDNYNIGLFTVTTSGGNTTTEPYWNETTAPNVTVKNGYVEYSDLSTKPELWKVPVGTYIIMVENMTAAEAHGSGVIPGYMHVSGVSSQSITVTAGTTTNATVECKPDNSKVTVSKTASFDEVFTPVSITVKGNDNRQIPMSWTTINPATKNQTTHSAAYMPAEINIGWELNVKKKDDTSVTYSSTSSQVQKVTAAGKWTNISFDASSTEGVINVTITVSDAFGGPQTVTETLNPLQ